MIRLCLKTIVPPFYLWIKIMFLIEIASNSNLGVYSIFRHTTCWLTIIIGHHQPSLSIMFPSNSKTEINILIIVNNNNRHSNDNYDT